MKRSDGLAGVRVTADGEVVVSHAGAERSREMAGLSGLIDTSDAALMPRTRRCRSPPGCGSLIWPAIPDGADSISDLKGAAVSARPVRPGRVDAHRVAGPPTG